MSLEEQIAALTVAVNNLNATMQAQGGTTPATLNELNVSPLEQAAAMQPTAEEEQAAEELLGGTAQPEVELDKNGHYHDPRIHAGTKSKTTKGIWKRRQGVTKDEYDRLLAEQSAAPAAPQASTQAAIHQTAPQVSPLEGQQPTITAGTPIQQAGQVAPQTQSPLGAMQPLAPVLQQADSPLVLPVNLNAPTEDEVIKFLVSYEHRHGAIEKQQVLTDCKVEHLAQIPPQSYGQFVQYAMQKDQQLKPVQ